MPRRWAPVRKPAALRTSTFQCAWLPQNPAGEQSPGAVQFTSGASLSAGIRRCRPPDHAVDAFVIHLPLLHAALVQHMQRLAALIQRQRLGLACSRKGGREGGGWGRAQPGSRRLPRSKKAGGCLLRSSTPGAAR